MTAFTQAIVEHNGCLVNGETGDAITNFTIKVTGVLCDAEDPSGKPRFAEACIEVWGTNAIRTMVLDLGQRGILNQVLKKYPDAILIQPRAKSLLEVFLRCQVTQVGAESSLTFLHSGLNRIRGSDAQFAFIAGNKLLTPVDGAYKLGSELDDVDLCLDRSIPVKDAVRYLCELISGERAAHSSKRGKTVRAENEAAGVLSPIWDYTVLSCFRSEINKLDITTYPVVFLQGGPGVGKTTTANRLAGLYGGGEGEGSVIDLGSSTPSTIDYLSKARDRVVIIDDLARCTSSSEERKRKERVASLIRFVTNRTPNRKYAGGNSVESRLCQCGCVFTGEYLDMSASEIERIILIRLEERMHGGIPQDRGIAGTALGNFIKWVIPHLKDYLDILNERLIASDEMENPRLQKTGELLTWAHDLFLQFSLNIGAINEKECRRLSDQGRDIIKGIIRRQIVISEMNQRTSTGKSLAHYIWRAYQDNSLPMRKKKKAMPYQDCYVENDTLFVPIIVLINSLSATPYSYLGEKTLGKKLREEGLIPETGEKRSSVKGKDGARWLQINLNNLEEKSKRLK